jgi:alpha-tubulin suppressor-like RCC1 family protein
MKVKHFLNCIGIVALFCFGATQQIFAAITAISAGNQHTCVLTEEGGVKCFGNNGSGQLGDGTTDHSRYPVNVIDPNDESGLFSGVLAISAGGDVYGSQTCALIEGELIKCWGWNEYGQLGNGSFDDSSVPVSVEAFFWQETSFSAGNFQTCAIGGITGTQSDVWCWGLVPDQSSDPDEEDYSSPYAIQIFGTPSDTIEVTSARGFNCALSETGRVKCWGTNSYGELGNGTIGGLGSYDPFPAYVVDPDDPSGQLQNVVSIDAGGKTACTIIEGGRVRCWGFSWSDEYWPPDAGALGNGLFENSAVPVDVIDPSDPSGLLTGIVSVSVGGGHSCALTVGGSVKCWGDNGFGTLGTGTYESTSMPVDVVGLPDGVAIVSVSAGSNHTCVLTEESEVWCWGLNSFWPGGDDYTSVPVHVFIDTTPPNIVPNVSGTLGNDDWYLSDVTVTWTVTDDESGISSTTGCEDTVVDTDTTGTTITCSALSDGGFSSESVTIKRDATVPAVTATALPLPNANGWNNTDVTVVFSGIDATSGVDSCSPSVVLNSEGIEQSASGTCTDEAGNESASVTASGINIDKTAPIVTVTGVVDGETYVLGNVPIAGCETTDALSGVQTPASLTVTGGNGDGTGSFTATCSGATDYAGNDNAVSIAYTVITPQAATASIIEEVDELLALEVVNEGQTTAMTRILEQVINQLDRERPSAAVRLLEAFIREVNSFMTAGILSPEQGQSLIDAAQEIIGAISV